MSYKYPPSHQSFTIAPAAGGTSGSGLGGGGGGILINSEGPPDTCPPDFPGVHGQGYGGGGFYGRSDTGCDGFDGVVILDFL